MFYYDSVNVIIKRSSENGFSLLDDLSLSLREKYNPIPN